MCERSFEEPRPIVRRSPRLQGTKPQPCLGISDTTSRRLVFPDAQNNSDYAVTSRRVQLHQSLEPIIMPMSVDPKAGCTVSALDSENHPTQEPRIEELQLDATEAPSLTARENSLQNDTFSVRISLDQQRRVHLQSSVEPVSVPSSVEILPAVPISGIGDHEVSSDREEITSSVRDLEVNGPQRNSPRGAEVLIEDEENESLRASDGDEQAGMFTFLLRMSVRELRKLLKSMKLKQQGNKGELMSRILVSADIRLAAGETIAQIMTSHQSTARYQSWVQHQRALDERTPQYWAVCPSLQQLLLKLGHREAEEFRKRKATLLRSREVPGATTEAGNQAMSTSRPVARNQRDANTPVETFNFSISEFARLCIIIRDDEDAKAALLATGQELTRSQMDAGFSRESFWGVIQSRFNDAGLRLRLSMVGNVDDVDSTQPPPCHRSATFLKEKFYDARSSFTTCVENWSKSGQNDTSNFKSFAGSRNGELTAAGKRHMVLFVCTRLGTENEDTRFRSMCLRTIPYNGGLDEGGSAAQLRTESFPAQPAPSRSNSRRNSGSERNSVDQSVVQLSEYVIARGRQREISDEERREERRERREHRKEQREEEKRKETEKREAKKKRSMDNRGLRQLEENHKLIKLLRYTTETLKS